MRIDIYQSAQNIVSPLLKNEVNMAKGNWKPDVIKPKTRCRYCGYVLKNKEIRYVGYIPCHAECANKRNLVHTAIQLKAC